MGASKSHKARIRSELKTCGISMWGLLRPCAAHLGSILHGDEHIQAAIAGRSSEMQGFFGIFEAMLVATDKRVIYVDWIPGFTTLDEISYDVVSGVNLSKGLGTASVTLFTRVSTYKLSHVRPIAALRFAEYIEGQPLVPKNPPQIPDY